MNGKFIWIQISPKFVPTGPIGNKSEKQQAIIWTNADPIHWRIYEALSGDESISSVLQCLWHAHAISLCPSNNRYRELHHYNDYKNHNTTTNIKNITE